MATLHLIDINPDLVDAWKSEFSQWPEVDVRLGDILVEAHGAIVSPANSIGHMDGGIDQLYLDFFGLGLQKTVYRAIRARPEGHLPIGASLIVPTKHARIAHLIVAPTMHFPGRIENAAHHAFFAMTAVLRAIDSSRGAIADVYCPGLGTGSGRMPPREAAKAMAGAYRQWLGARQKWGSHGL